ncbi:MAG: hypothetical protein KKA35_14360, partial [Proteobacteria bacterium]|nr:hypothetical protein [Pseudomonadota bacterium]
PGGGQEPPGAPGLLLARTISQLGTSEATSILTQGESDGAYGQLPFEDPFVFPVMSVGAIISGIAITPFVYIALRKRNLKHCAYLILPVVLISIVLFTIIDPRYGMVGGFSSLVLSIIFCILVGIGKTELTATEPLSSGDNQGRGI